MSGTFDEQIKNCIEACGYKLYACQLFRAQKRLEVMIDNSEKKISIEDCVKATKAIQYHLADNDLSIEVSSPGINRPLLKGEHYISAVGEMIQIKIQAGEKISGTLTQASKEEITLRQNDGQIHTLPLSSISNGKLITSEERIHE